jgi:electron transfer flavoprotein beta subunit
METRFKVASAGTAIDEAGVKYDMGDFDSYAVEVALQLNEKHGGGETVVISLGPDVVQEPLRKAMSMGADRAVQLKTDAMPIDGSAVAAALAAELKDGGFDLIFFGRTALDTNAGNVAIMTAEALGLPAVNAISKIDIGSGSVTVRRDLEGAAETLELPLPAVLGIDEGIARPRYPSLKGIMAAKKKPLESKPAQLGEQRLSVTRMELPADRPPGRIIGEGAAAVPELVRLLQTEAKVI